MEEKQQGLRERVVRLTKLRDLMNRGTAYNTAIPDIYPASPITIDFLTDLDAILSLLPSHGSKCERCGGSGKLTGFIGAAAIQFPCPDCSASSQGSKEAVALSPEVREGFVQLAELATYIEQYGYFPAVTRGQKDAYALAIRTALAIASCAAESPSVAAQVPPSGERKALESVLRWAKQRCPCDSDLPKICPLCDADVDATDERGRCKAVDVSFPPSLLREIEAAVAATPPRAQDESKGYPPAGWRETLESFVNHYPVGINPFLDEAFRTARRLLSTSPDATEAGEEKKSTKCYACNDEGKFQEHDGFGGLRWNCGKDSCVPF